MSKPLLLGGDPGTAAGPATTRRSVELWDYVRVLRRRWPIVVATTLITLLVAGVLSLLATPLYQARAQVFVSTQTSGSGAAELFQGNNFAQQRVQSYADIATTPAVLAPVIDELDLGTTPQRLATRVTATIPPQTVLINLTVTDEDPQTAARITDALADSFVETVTALERPVDGGSSPVRVSIVEPASVPGTPISPNVVRNLGLGVVLGLLVGIGLALLRHTLDTTLRSEDDVRDVTDATLLGVIPFDDDAEDRPLVVQADPHGIRAEALRSLRTNLQFVDATERRASFVVTSSVPSEGKSSTAANLAITLAEAGARVCLIEGDLRRPKASEYLGVEGGVGLTTVLIGEAELDDVLQPWGARNLYVLPAGQVPPNPSELLGSQVMADLLARIEGMFDHVVIDAPPLLPVTDAAILSTLADGVMLVIGSGTAERRELERSLDKLEAVDARVLGIVINRLPVSGRAGYGYTAYGYAPGSEQKAPSRAAARSGSRFRRRPAPRRAANPRAGRSRARLSQDSFTPGQPTPAPAAGPEPRGTENGAAPSGRRVARLPS